MGVPLQEMLLVFWHLHCGPSTCRNGQLVRVPGNGHILAALILGINLDESLALVVLVLLVLL